MPPVDSLQVIDLQPSPEREAIGGEVRDRVWAVFQRLPARQREVVALRHFEGWSTEEIASSLGVTSGSVKRHLFRAVQRLRAALGEQR
jgi:RNA polymerase sigma-70 factor (ECF subfamily)